MSSFLGSLQPFNVSIPEKLARDMRALNESAVMDRYGEKDTVPAFKYVQSNPTSPIQTLKSLRCWLYQCREGDVPESKLYKFFTEDFEKYLLERIVSDLPEYEKAEWA